MVMKFWKCNVSFFKYGYWIDVLIIFLLDVNVIDSHEFCVLQIIELNFQIF